MRKKRVLDHLYFFHRSFQHFFFFISISLNPSPSPLFPRIINIYGIFRTDITRYDDILYKRIWKNAGIHIYIYVLPNIINVVVKKNVKFSLGFIRLLSTTTAGPEDERSRSTVQVASGHWKIIIRVGETSERDGSCVVTANPRSSAARSPVIFLRARIAHRRRWLYYIEFTVCVEISKINRNGNVRAEKYGDRRPGGGRRDEYTG